MICARSRQDQLHHVKTLNLWGGNLKDVSIIKELTNVEVLSLSLNSISSLQIFSHCTKLRELYLRKNNVHQLEEICYLQKLPALEVLWLSENPCSEHPNYRKYVLEKIPHLKKLDDVEVLPSEFQARMPQSVSSQQDCEENEKNIDTATPPQPTRQQQHFEEQWRECSRRTAAMNTATDAPDREEQWRVDGKKATASVIKTPERGEIQDRDSITVKGTPERRILQAIPSTKSGGSTMNQSAQPTHTGSHRGMTSIPAGHRGNSQTRNRAQRDTKSQMEGSKRSRKKQHNILSAVYALLETLDESGLEWVQKEVNNRLLKVRRSQAHLHQHQQ